MEINELLEAYVKKLSEDNQKLVSVAFDEMRSSQHEEAARHFDQLYVKNPSDYMSFFFRAYNKSFCGRRGDVYPDAQTLTSAFNMACKKAVSSSRDYEVNMYLLLQLYSEAMDNLAVNAVEEVDEKGNTSNPEKHKIRKMERENIVAVSRDQIAEIQRYGELKEFVVSYLKEKESDDLKNIGALIVLYDPSYEETFKKKMKIQKIKGIVGICIALGIIIAVILIGVLS